MSPAFIRGKQMWYVSKKDVRREKRMKPVDEAMEEMKKE